MVHVGKTPTKLSLIKSYQNKSADAQKKQDLNRIHQLLDDMRARPLYSFALRIHFEREKTQTPETGFQKSLWLSYFSAQFKICQLTLRPALRPAVLCHWSIRILPFRNAISGEVEERRSGPSFHLILLLEARCVCWSVISFPSQWYVKGIVPRRSINHRSTDEFTTLVAKTEVF